MARTGITLTRTLKSQVEDAIPSAAFRTSTTLSGWPQPLQANSQVPGPDGPIRAWASKGHPDAAR